MNFMIACYALSFSGFELLTIAINMQTIDWLSGVSKKEITKVLSYNSFHAPKK